MKKRGKKISKKVTVDDYIKAVKIADREMQQADTPGWISTHKIHPSKKTYNRRENKRIKE